MSREQVSITELLLQLDSPELLQVEQVRAEVNQLLSTGEHAGLSGCVVCVCVSVCERVNKNRCVVTCSVS